MPVVNPGIRRFLGSAIQRLFNGASFSAPLTHSAIPTRAASGTTGTFTRATTATVRDNEGVLRTAIAGEARFEGARRVRNLLTYTEDFSNAAWVASNVTKASGVSDPLGTSRAGTITATANNGLMYQAVTPPAATGYVALNSVYIRRRTGTGAIYFRTANNVDVDVTSSVTTSWTRIYSTPTAPAAGTWYFVVKLATSGDAVDVYAPQLEDITGRADQATPSEYVSVGVESAPYYHGSMVDGVKCFATDINGAAIPSTTLLGYLAEGARTNYCLQSENFSAANWIKFNATVVSNQATAPDGTLTADLLYPTTTGSFRYLFQQILGISTAGVTVSVFSVYIKQAGKTWVCLGAQGGGQNEGVYFDIANGVVGTTVGAGCVGAIEPAGNGWWRCSVVQTDPADANLYPIVNVVDADNNGLAVTTSGTDGVYIWGADVKLSGAPTSYIATTTAAVTRNADVLTYSSSGNISGTVGAAYAELGTNWSSPGAQKNALGFSASIDGFINHSGSIATGLRIYDSTNSVEKASVATMQNSSVKYAGAWSGSAMSLTGGGAAVATGSFDGSIGGTTIAIGCSGAGTSNWDGTIKNVRTWQRALSSSELQAITS